MFPFHFELHFISGPLKVTWLNFIVYRDVYEDTMVVWDTFIIWDVEMEMFIENLILGKHLKQWRIYPFSILFKNIYCQILKCPLPEILKTSIPSIPYPKLLRLPASLHYIMCYFLRLASCTQEKNEDKLDLYILALWIPHLWWWIAQLWYKPLLRISDHLHLY